MTTSVGNNLVFRSFFEKQKLTGPNFIDWYRQLRLPIPPSARTLNEWVKNQKEIAVMMLLTMDLEIQRNLAHLGANDMLTELKALYSKQAEQELLQTMREFHMCKQEEGQSNYNMHSMGKTVNELHAMLKLHEETLPKKVAAPALHAIRAGKGKKAYANAEPSYAPKPKNPPPPKKDNPAKDAICHHCGEVGHWRRNCPTYLTELLKKKQLSQGASTSGIFTIELNSFPRTSWVYDTGCGTHICNTTQGLRGSKKLNPGALSLYMGNGQRAAVEAIGNYHLCLPSGLVIVLNNCHYAPSITRGIFQFSFDDDGFINVLNWNNASVSKIMGNKRAKLNLNSSLLWHCRLGHDSKKRIEKLKHDRLLNSTNIESLGKDFAHRTPPYTPQHNGVSERRNRTLLDMVRSMMSQTTLPKSFWDYALESAARILNMVPTKKVDKTPYEIWYGKP
ncbi:zinc finger, CCHC-type containing protein [Tanacetum coccineum]